MSEDETAVLLASTLLVLPALACLVLGGVAILWLESSGQIGVRQ